MSKMTQSQRILWYMKEYGGITQLEALRDLGVMRLASRISDLRKEGHRITADTEVVRNRFEEPCRVKRYRLAEEGYKDVR